MCRQLQAFTINLKKVCSPLAAIVSLLQRALLIKPGERALLCFRDNSKVLVDN